MNSWMARPESAWEPPFMMFIIGRGRLVPPPKSLFKCLKRGMFCWAAARRAAASEIPRIALAPNFDLFSVPSRSSIFLSMASWSLGSMPMIAGASVLFTCPIALRTPFPR